MKSIIDSKVLLGLLKSWTGKAVVVHDEFGLHEKLRISYAEPDAGPEEQVEILVENALSLAWPITDNIIMRTIMNATSIAGGLSLLIGDTEMSFSINERTHIYIGLFGGN